LKTVGKIDLADLGAYNAILWYGDDKTDQDAMNYKEIIREYLEYGGKIFYSGYRPSKTFEGITSLSQSFQEGDFLYDCFKISGVNYGLLAKFNGATPVEFGYYDLLLDPAKVGSTSDLHINGIEVFELQESGVKIYDYHSDYDVSSPQGTLSGGAVGVEYIGEDFSSVVLSFPLYYMQENSALNFINYVFGQKFGLTTDIETDEENIPNTFSLMQNYPNPFNPSTKIKFSILHSQFTTLKVFDILGREVRTLVNEVKQPGTYEVEFNASDLSSGIYFYSIKAGEFSAVKKLMLIK
jgi:hypothetical protein